MTANHKDFARSADEAERLADDLIEDVTALGQAEPLRADVSIRRDLASVIEQDFPAQHGVVIELRERLRKDRAFFATVYDQLNDVNNQLYADADLDPDLDVEWEDLDLDFIHDLHDFDVVGVATGRSGSPSFVRIIGHADVQYRVEVSAWGAFDDRGLPVRQDIDWNERTEKGTLTEVLPAELDFQALYVTGESRLAEVELTTIREKWDWVAEGRLLGSPVKRPEHLP